jgi:hypothetical protein
MPVDTIPATPIARTRRLLRGLVWNASVIIITLLVAELTLQWFNPVYLRMHDWNGLGYQYDPELGWSLVPNSATVVSLPRTVTVKNNSLGLRDIEPERDAKPTILFLGDSFVWGYNVEDSERFTDLLRSELPGYRIVNAGVTGYGTDQEYLLMRRIWELVNPDVVVLMFCVENDRADNSKNVRYFSYKPYLRMTADGDWQFAGQPVPKERRALFKESSLARTSMLARLAISAYVELRYWRITVPDPTERLIGMMREFVEARGRKFAVGVQRQEPQLEAFLRRQGIPQASFEGAELYDSSRHWTPDGHKLVARRLMTLFAETGILTIAKAQSQSRLNP